VSFLSGSGRGLGDVRFRARLSFAVLCCGGAPRWTRKASSKGIGSLSRLGLAGRLALSFAGKKGRPMRAAQGFSQEDMCSESDHGLSWRATALVGSKLLCIGAELSPIISGVLAP
jgi:hypothetical protein